MAKKTKEHTEEISEAEAEKRATEALRRALTTPHQPQREVVGKRKQQQKKRPN